MRLPISWLKEYVDFDDTPKGLAEKLTFSGSEVEAIETIGSTYDGVVVGEVLAVERHPNADKLTLCRVNTGAGELVVVCGAPNVKPGMKAPFAPAGVTLPNGLKLKAAKIRGVESHGMLCAEDELGLSQDHSGLMVLDPKWAPGTPLSTVLGPPETVLVLEITPNRPDCLSIIGIAREVAAMYGSKVKWPEAKPAESGKPAAESTRVDVEDAEGCPRYTARVIRDIAIGPSPDWMQKRLQWAGIRAINNVVDITNYVMLECGQPLHAFDQSLLKEGRIVVRRARPGEKMATLDSIDRPLTETTLVIADAERPVAMAGIMGGAGSEIQNGTQTVLLESAYFKPQMIRATSKRLGLSTESSYRFERTIDISLVEWASRRAAMLMAQYAGGSVAPGVVDVFPNPPALRKVSCRFDRINGLLGLDAKPEQITQVFESLGLAVQAADASGCTVGIPAGRVDLSREVDLAEEFVRIHGLDKIPAPTPRAEIVAGADDSRTRAVSICRSNLVALGLREVMNYSFVADRLEDLFDAGGAVGRVVLPNPVNLEQSILRDTLIPQMADTLGRNLAHQQREAALFELGRVFHQHADGKTSEEERLAIGLMGPVGRAGLDRRRATEREEVFLWLKGIWEGLASAQNVSGWALQPAARPYLESGYGVEIVVGGAVIGVMGLLKAEIRREWRMTEPVAVLEVLVDPLLGQAFRAKVFSQVAQFPAVTRDVAFICGQAVRHEDVLGVVKKVAPKELERVDLFDIFSAEGIGAGRKSMAYSFTYRSLTRTLTDEEANGFHETVKAALKTELGVEVREG